MAYVSIPKDLDAVRNKIMFGLTLRQIICLGAGASIGVPVYFLTKDAIGTTNASLCMMVVLLPAFMMAIFEKDGLPLEQVLMNHIRNKYLKPEVRMYKSKTYRRDNNIKKNSKNQRSENRRKASSTNPPTRKGISKSGNSKNIRVPGSDIPKNSPIKGTLIRDPFEDDEESNTGQISISFAKDDDATAEATPRQPISDEIILQEIRKNIGYEHGVEEKGKKPEKKTSPATPRYQYRGMPSFLKASNIVSFDGSDEAEEDEDDLGIEDCQDDDPSHMLGMTEEDFLVASDDISGVVAYGGRDNVRVRASDPCGMLPVEDYLDRLLNSVG